MPEESKINKRTPSGNPTARSKLGTFVAITLSAIGFAGAFLFLVFISWGAVLGVAMTIACMLAVVGIQYLLWGWWLSPSRERDRRDQTS